MRNRILSVVLAISMIAVVFSAIPTRAEVTDTGVVTATDLSNTPKSVFIQGELIYFDVKTVYLGNASARTVTVELGTTGVQRTVTTNATTGWYNSSTATPRTWLATNGLFIPGTVQAYDLVATVGGDEIARFPVVVKKSGISLDPPTSNYWPGLTVTWTLVTSHMTESLYVQVLNMTDVTVYNYTTLAATGYASASFTVGDWKDGTYHIHVRYAANHTQLYGSTFTVAKFDFIVSAERTWFLPGETATIDYVAVSRGGQALPVDLAINYRAQYWVKENGIPTLKWQNGPLLMTETKQFFPIVPDILLNRSPAVHIDYWANATNASLYSAVNLHVDVISETITLNAGGFVPGDTVVATVDALVGGNDLPGANVSITVTYYGNATQELPDYGASGLVTDLSGTASHSFVLADTSARGTYVVKATISKLGYSTSREATFTVSFTYGLTVSLDKPYYYGGEQATVTFEAQWNRAPIPQGTVDYLVSLDGAVLATGSTTNPTVTVDIPTEVAEGGTLTASARMIYLGYQLTGADTADIILTRMSLAVKSEYRAGDSLTWTWSIVTGLTSGTLTWEIFDSHGIRVAEGSPSFAKTGSFKYSVPRDNPASFYSATMRMVSSTGAYVTASDFSFLVSALEFKVWVDKSPYADGMFAPGQELKIRYSITAVTAEESGRAAYRIHVDVENDPISLDVLTSKQSGEITYKVPKTATVGQLGIDVELEDAATGDPLGAASTTFVVNNRESAWDLSLGGMTIIDLVLLILLVIVFLVLILMPYMKGRMGKPKAPATSPSPPPVEQGKMPPSP